MRPSNPRKPQAVMVGAGAAVVVVGVWETMGCGSTVVFRCLSFTKFRLRFLFRFLFLRLSSPSTRTLATTLTPSEPVVVAAGAEAEDVAEAAVGAEAEAEVGAVAVGEVIGAEVVSASTVTGPGSAAFCGPDWAQWVSVTPDGSIYDAGPYNYPIPRRFVAGRVYSFEGDNLGSVDWDENGNLFFADWTTDKFAAGCESCMRKAAGTTGSLPAPISHQSIFSPTRRAQGTWGSAGGGPLTSGGQGFFPGVPSVQTGPTGPMGAGGSLAPWLEGPMWDFDVEMRVPNFEDLPEYQEPEPDPQPMYLVAPPGGSVVGLIPIEGVGYVTPREAIRHGARLLEDGTWDLSATREKEAQGNGGGAPCDNPFSGARAVYEEPDVPKQAPLGLNQGTPLPRRAGGVTAPGRDSTSIIKRGIVPAVQEGSHQVSWCQMTVGEYELMVTCEPITVGGLRLPTSMAEEFVIGNLIGALPLTKVVSDARWAQGEKIVSLGLNDKSGELWNDPSQVQRYNATIGPNTGKLRDGYQKEGVLVANLQPTGRGALAQYGLRKNAAGATFENGTLSGHDENYKGYSLTPNYMSFSALKNGVSVDLRDELAVGCSLGGPLPDWQIQKFRDGAPGLAVAPASASARPAGIVGA